MEMRTFEEEEMRNCKKEDEKEKIMDEYLKIMSTLKFEFKVSKFFIVYFKNYGFGRQSKVEYFELIQLENEWTLSRSFFLSLKHEIINLKIKSYCEDNELLNRMIESDWNITWINEFEDLLKVLEIKKK